MYTEVYRYYCYVYSLLKSPKLIDLHLGYRVHLFFLLYRLFSISCWHTSGDAYQDNTNSRVYCVEGNQRFSQGVVFRNTVQNMYLHRWEVDIHHSLHVSYQRTTRHSTCIECDSHPCVSEQEAACIQWCLWEACNQKDKKTRITKW